MRNLLIFFAFLPYLSFGQNAAKIQGYLKKMDSSFAFRHASWGFSMLNNTSGKIIAQFQSEKSLVPASVQKVFTTASALSLLGDTFHFKTTAELEGSLENNGILNGNIIIVGRGNPVLGSLKGSEEDYTSIIKTFAQQIKSKGVKQIKGKLAADVSYFEYEPIPSSWIWFDIGNYYAPQIGALNLMENQYELYFKPGKKEGDSSTFLSMKPLIPGLTIVNHTITAIGGGDQTYIPGPPREMTKHIYGKMPAGESFKVKGALPRPEIFFLRLLKEELNRIGVRIDSLDPTPYLKTKNTKPLIKLYTHDSPTLSEVCQYANQTSNNISSECILRTLGAEKGKEGSTAEGIEVLKKFLAPRVKNVNSLKITDGSGLSKYNLCSPLQMTQFLSSIQKEKWFTCFLGSLPVSGKEGTMERICDGTAAEGKVMAKSGTMERVKCYAGYLKAKNGQLNPFSIFVNNHNVSNKEIVKWIEGLMEICIE